MCLRSHQEHFMHISLACELLYVMTVLWVLAMPPTRLMLVGFRIVPAAQKASMHN